jgi:hypothetical protein
MTHWYHYFTPIACTSNADHTGMAIVPFVLSPGYIRFETLESFGRTPCAWPVRVCEWVLHGDRDFISIAGILTLAVDVDPLIPLPPFKRLLFPPRRCHDTP